jgi:hypothetical protein
MICTSASASVNIIYIGTIDPYITYGVVFVQFHWNIATNEGEVAYWKSEVIAFVVDFWKNQY